MYHLHARYLSKAGQSSVYQAYQYIRREGEYKFRGDKVLDCVNLFFPEWRSDDQIDAAAMFWKLAESTGNRSNARLGYMLVFGLPKILDLPVQRQLASQFAQEVARLCVPTIATKSVVPVSFAIHEGFGRNPHVHLLVSNSIQDGIHRRTNQFFKRYNAEKPAMGGARRSRKMATKQWLLEVRELWSRVGNECLKAHGFAPNLDHRSNLARGLSAAPTRHRGPRFRNSPAADTARPSERSYRSKVRHSDLEETQNRIKERRLKIKALDSSCLVDEIAEDRRNVVVQNFWEQFLLVHPFSIGAQAIKSASTCLAVESDISNIATLRQALRSDHLKQRMTSLARDNWDAIQTSAGYWLIRVNQDEAIFVGEGYVVTDCTCEEGLQMFAAAVALIPFAKPKLSIHEDQFQEIATRILETGYKGSVSRRAIDSKLDRSSMLTKR